MALGSMGLRTLRCASWSEPKAWNMCVCCRNLAIGSKFEPVYIMMKKNTPVRNRRGMDVLSSMMLDSSVDTFSTMIGSNVSNSCTRCGRHKASLSMRLHRGSGRTIAPSSSLKGEKKEGGGGGGTEEEGAKRKEIRHPRLTQVHWMIFLLHPDSTASSVSFSHLSCSFFYSLSFVCYFSWCFCPVLAICPTLS